MKRLVGDCDLVTPEQLVSLALVHAFALSRLDYCNIFFYGIPDYFILQLQAVRNADAGAAMRASKQNTCFILLMTLQWLPVKDRVKYKLGYKIYVWISHDMTRQ